MGCPWIRSILKTIHISYKNHKGTGNYKIKRKLVIIIRHEVILVIQEHCFKFTGYTASS
jgi:hypothetical protein